MPPILLAVDKSYPKGLMWFRRDLRVDDNAALYHALRACRQLVCVFVFDRAILDALPRRDRRVEFIRESLVALAAELRALGGGLIVRHGFAEQEIPALAHALDVQAVYANRDDEPDAIERDARIFGALADHGIAFHTCEGPGDFRARRAAHARPASPTPCSRPTSMPGWPRWTSSS